MPSRKTAMPAPAARRSAGGNSATAMPPGTGNGGEIHQTAGVGQPLLTSNQGLTVADNQNSLHGGHRGPTLLEDFLLREKITHFDHERIPERIVHARGSAAHGYFECLRDCNEWTKASFLSKPRKRTPVFTRFSTVAGGAGSVDTPRDVRGFAVKFYTDEGNFDLVGNNIPVFFIQDAIKFPDLIHAVKMEPDRGFPQAASAHDTFWDFVSLMPESLHMIMWAMSDRTIPRSLRMIDGFGVHTFRLVNAAGDWQFVKFHWRAGLGVESTTWDEAVKIAGADTDYHRRDLWESIERGDFPTWELGLQVFDQATADSLPFDVLDPTKVIPEEIVPIEVVGRMVLDRNPSNFFAETEQVAFCPSHLVPGLDFSNDPLLQGRLHSYLDTQLSRLGTPNFHQLPINQARCPVTNFQRDGLMQMQVPTGRVAYEPNSLGSRLPRESPERGFNSVAVAETGPKQRLRPESFADHYSQARLFFRSMTATEQGHMVNALAFELGKVETGAVRDRVLSHLVLVDETLAQGVADKLGVAPGSISQATPARQPQDLPPSPALSQVASRAGGLKGRHLAMLVAEGADAELVATTKQALEKARARVSVVAQKIEGVKLSDGSLLKADGALAGSPSCLFGAVIVLGSDEGIQPLLGHPAALDFLRDAWRHLKAIGLDAAGQQLAQAAGIGNDEAVLMLSDRKTVAKYLKVAAAGKHFAREGQPGTDA